MQWAVHLQSADQLLQLCSISLSMIPLPCLPIRNIMKPPDSFRDSWVNAKLAFAFASCQSRTPQPAETRVAGLARWGVGCGSRHSLQMQLVRNTKQNSMLFWTGSISESPVDFHENRKTIGSATLFSLVESDALTLEKPKGGPARTLAKSKCGTSLGQQREMNRDLTSWRGFAGSKKQRSNTCTH